MDLRAVRPARRLAHGSPARARRGRPAHRWQSAGSPSRSTGRPSASATRSPPGTRAVFGAALNVACAGGEPLALTDCLNFGSPEKPEIAWELEQAIEGIAQAADELGIPVVSGNVSLYNETGGRSIPPTPVVGCVGLVRDVTRMPDRWRPGDGIFLLRGEGAELVRFVWQNAQMFSLAHDRPGRRPDARSARGCSAGRTSTQPTLTQQVTSRVPACSSRRASGRRGPTSSSWGSSDVRRLRGARTGPRRCAPDLLRPARPAAPRPGVGRDRRQRGRQADCAARPRPRRAGVRRTQPLRPARRTRDRPHALLDDRWQRLGERAAAAASRSRADGRARPQRQPRQRRGLAPNGRQAARFELGLRGDRGADRRRRASARAGRTGGDDAADRALRRSSGSPTASSSRSATHTGSARSCSDGSATTR